MTGWRRTAIWVGAALAGLVIAAGLTTAAATLSDQRVGISSEPLTAGENLAPAETATPTRTPTPRPTRTPTPRPRRTATPTPRPTAAPPVDDHGGDDNGGDDNSGSGGSGRGRGRGRGGGDD